MSPAVVLESTEWTSYVCSSLETLRQEGILCDTTLLGKNGRTLLAHSCVLAAASPVLRTVVTQQNLASFLHSTHYISRGVWDVILEFIYRGKVAIDSVTDAKSIMAAAEKLELEKLRTLCEDFLHIEGAILKDEGSAIVLDDEPQTFVKIEPGLTERYDPPVSVNVTQPAPSDITASVRIKAEPLDNTNTTMGGDFNERTDGSVYSFTSTRGSPSMPVSQAVDRMSKWTSARMATDMTDQIPVAVIPVDRLSHQLPGIRYAADDAAITDCDVTRKLPLLTRTLMSASEKLPFYRDARVIAGTDRDHEELPELVTVNDDSRSALHRSTVGSASSTVDDGPLCLDLWRAYNMVGANGYNHLTVNHSLHFVDPVTGAHTNEVENMWMLAKRRNKKECGTARSLIDTYLVEFMWRLKFGQDPFESILRDIRAVYPQ